jgi:hypothetical protein
VARLRFVRSLALLSQLAGLPMAGGLSVAARPLAPHLQLGTLLSPVPLVPSFASIEALGVMAQEALPGERLMNGRVPVTDRTSVILLATACANLASDELVLLLLGELFGTALVME